MSQKIVSVIKSAVNFLLPPQCALCKEIIEKPYALCGECWPQLQFITSPKCSLCGVPLTGVDQDMPCEVCVEKPPVYACAFAPLVYNDALKKLILRFKNYDYLNYTPMFVNWMQRCVPENIDIILPVPLHGWRFFVRQYNQSAELAKLLSKTTNIPCELNILKRHRSTPSQGHKNLKERYENLNNAFSVVGIDQKLNNRNLLLIDDVLTSGATVSACTKALKKAGAKHVYVLTIARAVRDHQFHSNA